MSAATSSRSSATWSRSPSHMTRERLRKEVTAKAELAAEERVLDALVGEDASAETREKFRRMLRDGELDDKEIEIQVAGQRRHAAADLRHPRHARRADGHAQLSATCSARRSAAAARSRAR